VLRHLWVIDESTAPRARAYRERTIEHVLAIFAGRGAAGDTTGNSPGSKWVAWNAIAEHLDFGRRYTVRTNQVQRSFEDVSLKQRALELVLAA
jgi:elongation factor P hydroxylase